MNGNLLITPGQPFYAKNLISSKIIFTSAALVTGNSAQLIIKKRGLPKIILAKFKKNHNQFQLLQVAIMRDDIQILANNGDICVAGVYEFSEADF